MVTAGNILTFLGFGPYGFHHLFSVIAETERALPGYNLPCMLPIEFNRVVVPINYPSTSILLNARDLIGVYEVLCIETSTGTSLGSLQRFKGSRRRIQGTPPNFEPGTSVLLCP